MTPNGQQDWQDIVSRKREEQAALVQPWLGTSEKDTSIESVTDVEDVAKVSEQLVAGKWSAEEVVRAYCKRWALSSCVSSWKSNI